MLTSFLRQLPDLLIPRPAWRPYPTITERNAWQALPAGAQQACLEAGQSRLNFRWPDLPATLFLEFARNGNRTRFEGPHFERRYALADLALAECIANDGRYLDDIANGIWAICEETYWGLPAHVSIQQAGVGLPDVAEPTVDLFAAETAGLLAWCDYLLGERLEAVSPLLRRRIACETKRRLLDPCLERDDFWWMSFKPKDHGVNNWNPWINSNWLTAALLLENDEARRLAAVGKILRSLDLFLDVYAEDGGCDEGPNYWGRAAASLFDCLELLYSATGGSLSVYGEAKIQNMARFVYRVHIGGDYYVNFADASAVVNPVGMLVFNFGRRIGDAAMAAFGAWLDAQQGGIRVKHGEGPGRRLPALFSRAELQSATALQPLPGDAWFPGTQVMVARDRPGSMEGLFVAAKGGHNGESHNHNDIGNFIVFGNGRPLIVDAGVETYTRKTFSPQRYEIWTMQSAYHSLLPVVDGVMQAPGEAFAARQVSYQADASTAQLALDIAGAYPPEAGIVRWQRTITLQRGQSVTIADEYELDHAAQEIALSLLTPCAVELAGPGCLRFDGTPFGDGRLSAAGQVDFPAEAFTVSVSAIPIRDERLGVVWGDHLNRVVFVAQRPPRQGRWVFQVRLAG